MTTFRQLHGYAKADHWAKNQWLLNHISGFMALYIAAVSAFSVTSLHFNSVQFTMADSAKYAPHHLVELLGAQAAHYAVTKLRFIRLTNAGPS